MKKSAKKPVETTDESPYKVEMVEVDSLTPHPQNYRSHPEDQLAHIKSSIEQHGFYRNVVVARDGTILAGHGVVLAAKALGLPTVPVLRLDLDPLDSKALKVLTADNELGRFAQDDDRMLSELLKSIRETDPLELLGTGYTDQMLAALVMVTRPATEIASVSEAAEYIGMPEYHEDDGPIIQLMVVFADEASREQFVSQHEIKVTKKFGGDSGSSGVKTWSARWPAGENEDLSSVRFTGGETASDELARG